MDNTKRVKICEFLREIWFLIVFLLLFLGIKIVVLLLDLYVYIVKYIEMITSAAGTLVIVAIPLLFVSGVIVGLKTFINNNAEEPKDFVRAMEEFITVEINHLKKWSKRIGVAFIAMSVFCKLLKGVTFLLIYNKVVMI